MKQEPKFPADRLDKETRFQIGTGCIVIVIMAITCIGVGILIDRYWL